MTYTELLHIFYYARRALQGLAALTGDDEASEIAGGLDELADALWRSLLA